jgi:fructokinase
MEKRWSAKGAQLPSDHPAWELEARYLALAVASFVCTLSPRRVILGGGVMEHPGLLESVRAGVADALGGYLKHDSILHGAEDFIVAPGLANRSGLLGAMAMAQDKLSA